MGGGKADDWGGFGEKIPRDLHRNRRMRANHPPRFFINPRDSIQSFLL